MSGIKKVIKTLTGKKFTTSSDYWENRYQDGGNSGAGSYNRLAEFKAETLNNFVKSKEIKSVIEFGCGDGNQLTLAQYPSYIGLDVSKKAIEICMEKFKDEDNKNFFLYNAEVFCDKTGVFQTDLSMSLDVIYHLVEDEVYETYMNHLFQSGGKYVIVYATNYNQSGALHVKHRKFTDWVEKNCLNFELIETIRNKYRVERGSDENNSSADFFIYKRK